MKKPEKGKILWLVKKNDPKTVLGFLKDRLGGCFIIGGPTGSHYTGHGEGWESKLEQYFREGYTDADLAKRSQFLPANWRPPEIATKDRIIIRELGGQVRKGQI